MVKLQADAGCARSHGQQLHPPHNEPLGWQSYHQAVIEMNLSLPSLTGLTVSPQR